jgi:uncharacterized LabA/DUF88 family protein
MQLLCAFVTLIMIDPFPAGIRVDGTKAMMFVDGENLVLRYQDLVKDKPSADHITHHINLFVWSSVLNAFLKHLNIIRRYYFTSVQGDDSKIEEVEALIRSSGFEAPRVFKKFKNRPSKQVDIALATEMLTHGFRGNYDYALLVSGDKDFVPVVDSLASEGRRILLWYVSSGCSPALKRAADHCFDLSQVLTESGGAAWSAMRCGT